MKPIQNSPALEKDFPNGLPKISIITPSLNQGRYIRRTIESVLSQEYPNLEYLVMDGGSTDNTLETLNSYAGRVTWVSENDGGQTQAINKGLRMASGDIVTYLNADDLLLPGALLKVARTFANNPGALWVTGKCRIINDEDREVRRWLTAYKNFWLYIHNRSTLLVMDYISQPATFWRAEALSRLGYLDEDLHYVMDYEYFLRLYTDTPLTFIPDYLAAFRIHVASKTTAKTSSRAGGADVYFREESGIIQRYTQSWFLFLLYRIHRQLMVWGYSLLNMG